jgi:transposase
MLEFSRPQTGELTRMDDRPMRLLAQHPRLQALGVGDPSRFASVNRAVSYCGLESGLRESAGQQKGGPLSKQRNRHSQTVLIEASKIGAKFTTRWPWLASWWPP